MVKIITRPQDMAAIAPQWNSLALRFGSPLLSYEWFRAGADTLLGPDELRIVVSHSDDDIHALAPLALRKHDGPERLEFLGARALGEPTGFLYDSDASLKELTTTIVAMKKPLLLSRLGNDSPEIQALCRHHGLRQFLRQDGGAPFITLPATWSDLWRGMSSDNRNHLRRKMKHLAQAGAVGFEMVTPDRNTVPQLLEEVIRIEAAGWKLLCGTAMAVEPRIRRFFQLYTCNTADNGSLRLCFLRVDGRPVAANIAVVHANRLWLMKTAYDERWARYSPGVLLTNETIRAACELGLEAFEFLGHNEQWIHRWTRNTHAYVTFRSYPNSLSGTAVLAIDACHSVADRPVQEARRKIRTSVGNIASKTTRLLAPKYIAGLVVEDAMRACRSIAEHGWRSTICPWDRPNDRPERVASSYIAALQALTNEQFDCYLSIKPPSLKYDLGLLEELLAVASERNIRIHFDALAPETASSSFELLEKAASIYTNLGCTLPSRWRRSLVDVERAVQLKVGVRVVKGQWADPEYSNIDPRANFAEMIDALAGRVPWVGVASHDTQLASESLRKLKKSQTPCELEQLYGLPVREHEVAVPLSVNLRIYIPYGYAYLPYALSEVRRRPVILRWMLRDLLFPRINLNHLYVTHRNEG